VVFPRDNTIFALPDKNELKTQRDIAKYIFLAILSWPIFAGSSDFHQNTFAPGNSGAHFNSPSSDSSKYLYIGIEKCAAVCHNTKDIGYQYDIIRKSPHAHAYNILLSGKAARYAKKANTKGDPGQSQVCLSCHITGAGLDSSFFAVTYKKEDGITCEACHKAPYTTKTFIPKEADCLKCHENSVHKTRKFDYKVNCAKIAHNRPAPKSAQN
jgi:Cytochrome c554 and c-prime